MPRLWTRWLIAAVALVGCGFETPAQQASGGASGNGNGAGATANTGGNPGSAGSAAGGQATMAGAAGTSVTPQGGGGQAGASAAGSGGVATAGAAGSTSGTGGAAGSGMAGAAGSGGSPPVDPHFKLLWRDDFDSFDAARWTKQTHTFDENLARFSAANVVVEGGLLKLKVTKVQNGNKAYSAAEVASTDLFTYGRFVGRIKFCAGSGMVSSLFTYKDNVNQSWQEIDIEHLGNLPKSIQYNLITGNLANRVYQPKVITLPYGPPLEFHDYGIDWTPDGISFTVDGVQTFKNVQPALKDAARLHMNAWPTDNSVTSFAGTFDPNAVPCEAQYDWIEAYSYTP